MSLEAYKAFSSVVHDAPAANLRAEKAFASVVHNAPAANLRAEKAFASVVHNAPAADLKAEKAFASVVHNIPGGKVFTEFIEHFDEPVPLGRVPTLFIEHFDEPVPRGRVATEFIEHFDEPVPRGRVSTLFVEAFLEFPTLTPPVAFVPDISGTETVLATFDGSGSTGDIDVYRWEWLSVPGGSAVANLPTEPFPDGGVTTWISMAGNQALYHGEGANADTSGNGNTAVPVNMGYAAGQVGSQAFDFLAANSTLQTTNLIPTTTGVYSVSFWFYDLQPNVTWRTGLRSEDGFTDHQFIIETGTDRAGLYQASLGAFVYANFDMPAASYTGWHHVVVVSTGTVTQYFVDGEFRGYVGHTCTTGIRSFGNLNTSLGANQRFAQRLDEIAVWNRALSFAEIASIYAVQSAAYAGTGVSFPFTPDVPGTYTVQLSVSNVEGGVSSNDNADAVIGAAPPSAYAVGVWPQEGNARMVNVQGQRLKRNRGQL